MNNPVNIEMQKKAIQRGIITKDTLAAYFEQSEAFHQRFGEHPRLNIAEGADAWPKQYERQFFEKEMGLQVVLDHEMGLVSLTNTVSNTMETIEYEHDYRLVDVEAEGRQYTVAIEVPVVSDEMASEYPHLAEKLSKLRVVNNNGQSIDDIMADLKAHSPNAIWVERDSLDDNFFLNKIIGKGQDRAAFVQEFEGNTGPKVLQQTNHVDYEDDGMSL